MAITRIGNPAIADIREPNFRNIIINGDMSLAQRATSVTSITTGGYKTVDRFDLAYGSIGTWTQTQSTDVPNGQGFSNSIKMDCTTADASPAASDYLYISQKVEGQNLQYLKKGTSNAESLTASFWVKSNKTGTYIFQLWDQTNDRIISKSYTISSSNTWEKKSVTFAGDTTGAFANSNAEALRAFWWLGTGSDFSSGTLATSWQSRVNANRAVGQVNLGDSTSNEWYVTGLQLEAGSVASDFEFLPVDVNLQRCYRYYRTLVPLNTENEGFSMGFYTANNNGRFAMHLENPMRTTPTLDIVTGTDYFKIFSAGGGDDELNSFSIMGNSTERFVIANNTGEASGTAGQAGYAQSSSNSAYLGLEAEL